MAMAWYLQLNWNSAPSIAAEKDSKKVSLFFPFLFQRVEGIFLQEDFTK